MKPHLLKIKIIIYNNTKKYDSLPIQKNKMIINNILESKENHYIAIFKDHLIYDFIYEFFHRFYNMEECKERLSKFYEYYKNYLLYFCHPTFCNSKFNNLVQDYGQSKAEIYYNKKYRRKEGKKVDKIKKGNLYKNIELIKSIFSDSIKKNIETNFNNKKNSYKKNKSKEKESFPSSVVLSKDSFIDSKKINNEESTILNIIEIMRENKNNLKTNANKNEDENQNIYKNANSKNHKIKLLSFKKINKLNLNLENKKINEPLTIRIKGNSQAERKNYILNINNFFPKNYKNIFTLQNNLYKTKNNLIENLKKNNDKKTIILNNNKKMKEIINLNIINDRNNYLYSLETQRTCKNLKINANILSNFKSPSKNNISLHKKTYSKNLSKIIHSIKKSPLSPKNQKYFLSSYNSIINNFNININNHIIISNSKSPQNPIGKYKKFSRNIETNLMKTNTDFNDYYKNLSNSKQRKNQFKSSKGGVHEIKKFLENNNCNSLKHKISYFHQKYHSFKTIGLTPRNDEINNAKGKSPYSLKIINNNKTNRKYIISSYKQK